MADCERDLYRKIAIVCNRDMENASLGEDEYKYHVDFYEPQYVDDQTAEYALDKEKLADGAMSILEWVRKYDSDAKDEAEAITRIKERKSALARINGARGSLADALRSRTTPAAPAVKPDDMPDVPKDGANG